MKARKPRQRIALVAILAAFGLTISACTAASTPEAAVTTQAPTTGDTAPPASVDVTTTPAPSAMSVLGAAVQGTGTRYAFTATVVVDGTETTRVDGEVFDGVSRYIVASGGRQVEYITAPTGQWARLPGDSWNQLSGPAPLADPLGPLAAAETAQIVSTGTDTSTIETTYDGSVLGFVDGSEVPVTITIVQGVLVRIEYEAPVTAGTATVTTTFDANAAIAPIEVPVG